MTDKFTFREDDCVSVLAEPINIRDLESGTDFTIDGLESAIENELKERVVNEACEFNENYFSMGKEGNDLRGNPGVDSFDTFAIKMLDLTEDGEVKKRILRQGQIGPELPDDCNVVVHYNAYLEYGSCPFDSTFLSGKPSRFSLLDCIEGLAIGIRAMKRKEKAQILVGPNRAYKSQGIPPRIPGDAKILYELELIDFEMGVDEATGLTSKQAKNDFKSVLAASRAKYDEANSCFVKADVRGAFIKYNKAMNMLERCNLANDEEEVEQEKLLLKVYTSLAVCLNKEKKAAQACNMCKCALKIKQDHPKALFHFGRALLMLGDFKEARIKLKKGTRLQPTDTSFQEELKKVDQKEQEYLAHQKLFAQRAFSGK